MLCRNDLPSPNRQQTIDTVTTPLIYGQSIEPNAMYVIAPLLQPEKVDEIDAVDQYATTVFQDDINPISFWIKEADDEGRPCLSRLVLNYLTIPASVTSTNKQLFNASIFYSVAVSVEENAMIEDFYFFV
ncbi:unnamed protein product [Clavelina lepadiformis]|uniref:HAT C-terminal dimerisation domain-containing protein n=1 Tax=Clavelina lepadiformis TaxID=159417 RepID=A0ABP0H3C0_CLALP